MIMFRALITLTSLLFTLTPAAAIVGGAQSAEPAVAPHVVLIAGAPGVCSGVAIAPDLVLTAAHCVSKVGTYKLAALDGSRMTMRNVASVATHPQFAPRDDAPDVALVKLAPKPEPKLTPVAFSDRRAPIAVGDRFIVAGFGLTNQNDRKSAGKLRTATLIATGKPNTQIINLVDPNTLGEKAGLGVCNGDSGGPVLEQRDGKLALIGIISWTAGPDGEQRCGFISGIIPLPRYHFWITETAAKLGSPLEP
jgi:secreted trypsin-like serine protease